MESDKEELSDKVKYRETKFYKFNPLGLSKVIREEYSLFIIDSNKSTLPFFRKKRWEEVKGPKGKPLKPKSFRALKAYLRKRLPKELYFIRERHTFEGTILTFEETTFTKNKEKGEPDNISICYKHLLITPRVYSLKNPK